MTKTSDAFWAPVNQAAGAGWAAKRPWTVQKPGQWFATDGRVHRYGSEAKAQKVADTLNLGESIREQRLTAPTGVS